MGTIKDMLRRAKTAEANFDSVMDAVVQKNTEEILDLNREDQLFTKHVGYDGSSIGVYAKTYKPRPGQPTKGFPKKEGEPYNLLGYGDFFQNFGLKKVSFNKVQIFNSDPKLKYLLKRSGDKLIGLTDENKQKMNFDILLNDLRKTLKSFFKKG